MEWDVARGWSVPRIVPYAPIGLDPAAGALNYAFQCFEGLKAFRDANGSIRLFRPEKNVARLRRSARRMLLPDFDDAVLLKLLARFVAVEERFVPHQRGQSLYLRPVILGTSPNLAVKPPTAALLYVTASPVGLYFAPSTAGLALLALPSDTATRAWPGGAGDCKVGANYAPALGPTLAAAARGFDRVLWLFGERQFVTEADTMNVFIVRALSGEAERELLTPPLDGLILDGVLRDSVLSLARERLAPNGWAIRERAISMAELVEWAEEGSLIEAFGTGTAAGVAPVGTIEWHGKTLQMRDTACAEQMRVWVEARQLGEDNECGWSMRVDSLLPRDSPVVES